MAGGAFGLGQGTPCPPVSPAMRQLVWTPAGLQAALGPHRAGTPWQAGVKPTVPLATWLASWEQPSSCRVDGDSCWHRTERRSQVKLRQLPEPTQSREFTGEVFSKKEIFLPVRLARCLHCGPSHKHLKARNHQRLLVPFLRLWGRESPLCSR